MGIERENESSTQPLSLTPFGEACLRKDLTAIHEILDKNGYKDDEGIANEVGYYQYILNFPFQNVTKNTKIANPTLDCSLLLPFMLFYPVLRFAVYVIFPLFWSSCLVESEPNYVDEAANYISIVTIANLFFWPFSFPFKCGPAKCKRLSIPRNMETQLSELESLQLQLIAIPK